MFLNAMETLLLVFDLQKAAQMISSLGNLYFGMTKQGVRLLLRDRLVLPKGAVAPHKSEKFTTHYKQMVNGLYLCSVSLVFSTTKRAFTAQVSIYLLKA